MITYENPRPEDWHRTVGWRFELEDGDCFASLPYDEIGDPATLSMDKVEFPEDGESPFGALTLRTSRRPEDLEARKGRLSIALGAKSLLILEGVMTDVLRQDTGALLVTLTAVVSEGDWLVPSPDLVADEDSFPCPDYQYWGARGGTLPESVRDLVYPVVYGQIGQFRQMYTASQIPLTVEAKASPVFLTENPASSAIGAVFSRFLYSWGWVEGDQRYLWNVSEGRGAVKALVHTFDRKGRQVSLIDLDGDATAVLAEADHAYYASSLGFGGKNGHRGLGSTLIQMFRDAKVPLDDELVERARGPLDVYTAGWFLSEPTQPRQWAIEFVRRIFPVIFCRGPSGRLGWRYAPSDSVFPDEDCDIIDVRDGGDVELARGYEVIPLEGTEFTVRYAYHADQTTFARKLVYGPDPAPPRRLPSALVDVTPSAELATVEAELGERRKVEVEAHIVWTDTCALQVARYVTASRARRRFRCSGRARYNYAPTQGAVVRITSTKWPWATGRRAVVTSTVIDARGYVAFTMETL